MPSQKPRLALTLPPELAQVLGDMAEALGRPVSAITVEFLVELMPQFEGITKMAIAAKAGNKPAIKRAMAHMMGDQFAELMAMQQPDFFGKPTRKKAPKARD